MSQNKNKELFTPNQIPGVQPSQSYFILQKLKAKAQDLLSWNMYNNESYDALTDISIPKNINNVIENNNPKTSDINTILEPSNYNNKIYRPFNDIQQRMSMAQINNPIVTSNNYDNSFFNLWKTDFESELKTIINDAKDLGEKGNICIPFKNINQCMTKCTTGQFCTGFYLNHDKNPNKCCFINEPPYNYARHTYDEELKNIDFNSHKMFVKNIKNNNKNIVFNKNGYEYDNSMYLSNISEKNCLKLCPKCKMNKCPPSYRCKNIKFNENDKSCVITNEDYYDENNNRLYS
jgi:hypothetical protein